MQYELKLKKRSLLHLALCGPESDTVAGVFRLKINVAEHPEGHVEREYMRNLALLSSSLVFS